MQPWVTVQSLCYCSSDHRFFCWSLLFKGWREKCFHSPFLLLHHPPPFFFLACTDHRFNHSWTSSGATWAAFKWPLIYALRCPVEVHFFTVVDTSFRWTKAGMLFKCSCVNHECPVWSFKPFFFFIIPFLSRECSRLHLREHCSSSAAWWHLFLAHYLDILGLTFF